MKTWKQGIIGIFAIIALIFAIIACDNDNGKTHTHEWEWVVTTHASYNTDGLETEKCKTCGETSGNTKAIAHPTQTEFNDKVMFTYEEDNESTDYLADILDRRSTCTSQNLQQLDNIEKLQDATEKAFITASAEGGRARNRFRTIFNPDGGNPNGKVKITIENGVAYTSYKVDNSAIVCFNFDYLSTVSDADLQTAITAAVAEMRDLIQ